MAIRRIEALELADLLGALLGSIISAQAQSARATVDFVEDIGFEATAAGERLRTVKVQYRKKDEDGMPAEFEVEVPLLAMVNVPSLIIRQAKLSFSYDVVTVGGPAEAPDRELIGNAKLAKLTGLLRKKTTGASTVAERQTMAVDVDVTIEQQDLPIGVE